jgi:DNA invertase Pin-like site-specific DNA recombinase
MRAVGYIRRSHAGEAAISEKVQRDTIARQAEARGLTVDRIYMDWGRSGRLPDDVDSDTLDAILAHRPQALALMRDIEAGNVGAVLAYRQDRLARDSFTLHLMIRWARRRRVPLIIPRGDITAREQRLLTAVEGGMDEEEGTRAKERSDAAERTMRERGDERGAPPYGWSRKVAEDGRIIKVLTDPDKPARVVAAFRSEGSYNGAARKLNQDGVPPPLVPKNGQRRGSAGPPMWSAATVRKIVQREAPTLAKKMKARPRTGRAFALRGLMRCHCGAPMTPSHAARGGPVYYCNRGKRGDHKPYAIAEAKLLPWIMEEADRVMDPSDAVYTDSGETTDTSADRQRLEAARDLIGEEAYAAALAKLDEQDAAGAERARILKAIPPPVEWKRWSTEDINKVLKARFDHIELGADLMPVRAEWRYPEWRRP